VVGTAAIRADDPGKGAGAGYGEEIPDAALHTWGLDSRQKTKPDSILRAAGRFKSVVLRPTVTVAAGSDVGRARTIHQPAHEKCFIANSVNFPVECEPEIVSGG